MRILMVPHAYLPNLGGVERVVQQLARFLRADGHDVGVLTDVFDRAPAHELLDDVPVWRVPFICWSRTTALRFWRHWPGTRTRLLGIVREFRPDVVHVHVTSANVPYAEFCARKAGCPLVVTTHGSFYGTLNRAGIAREARLCHHAASLTHCSAAAQEQFLRKQPHARPKSQVIYNGVAPDDYDDLSDQPAVPTAVLFAGRINRQKGVDVLLDAWRMLGDPPGGLMVAGDGPERDELQARACNMGLHHVTWCGTLPTEGLVAAMRTAAAFAAPSRDEGFPMIILEAMASGVPIVTTPVGGIPEQIADGVHGLLVQPENSEALAGALRRLLEDRDLALSLAARARERVLREFNWSRIVQQYVTVYSGEPC